MATSVYNDAQLQVLEMMSFVKTPEAWHHLQLALSEYFARQAQGELEKMWQSGELDAKKIESFRHLHERTPYHKSRI